MKVIVSSVLIVFVGIVNLNAQKFELSVAYSYLHSKQWTNAIQTYNFSRPFLEEEQPLLSNGIYLSGTTFLKSETKNKRGVEFNYTLASSKAFNTNFNNTLNMHLVGIDYYLRHLYLSETKGLYTEVSVGLLLSGLFRRIDGENLIVDDSKAKALGVGIKINLKNGYILNLGDHNYLNPFVNVGYSPYLYSPNLEAVINQTKGMLMGDWSRFATVQIGLGFGF